MAEEQSYLSQPPPPPHGYSLWVRGRVSEAVPSVMVVVVVVGV